MSTEQGGARLFDLGYRRYEGKRDRPARAILTLGVFTTRRVLGLGRGGRHKVLPAITLAIAFLPALLSVVVAVVANDLTRKDLITYADYTSFIQAALALFAALIAPEALCPDRRSGMLGLYLAGPLDRTRYVVAKVLGVYGVMLLIAVGPMLFMFLAYELAGFGEALSELPELLGQIVASGASTALLYTALALAVSSFTTRRAAAAVGVILLLFLPFFIAHSAVESAGAPAELDLVSFPFLASELAFRIFGETSEGGEPLSEVATSVVAGGVLGWSALALLVCWLRYRRIEAFR